MEVSSAVPKMSPAAGASAAPRMPAFARGTHGHSHTVHSALVSLHALGVSGERITLRRAGRDAHAEDAVVRQMPAAGTPLTPDTRVVLDVAGLGFTHALPVGMWDSGGESEAGTQEILAALDDPLEKLKHWFHEGAPLFRLAREDRLACSRWLALFGIDAADWPPSLWFPLASLVAEIPRLSCSEEGCAAVLRSLLGLPVQRISYHPTWTVLPEATLSRLGSAASQLGVDLLVGDAMEDLAMAEIEIGPVSLEVYEAYAESEAGQALLARVLQLLMPLAADMDVRWSVRDRTRAPRLGLAAQNSRLGVNSHLGAERFAVTGITGVANGRQGSAAKAAGGVAS